MMGRTISICQIALSVTLWLHCLLIISASEPTIDYAEALTDTLFPNESLRLAFEKNSLLSRLKNSGSASRTEECLDDEVPTVFLNASSNVASSDRMKLVSSLFEMDNIDYVLQQPNVQFKMGKKVVRDGQESLGIVPHEMVMERGALAWFQNGRFSLIIDKLERHWEPVAQFAKRLELEFGLAHVSCNLYLTPPNASGFEAHWDWMDVIVIQVSGEKIWSVAKEPTVHLSTEELKRKPSQDELHRSGYSNIRLHPGDALYIPRGTQHNASTTIEGHPSLHLTFGIESTRCFVGQWLMYVLHEEHHHFLIHKAMQQTSSSSVVRRSIPFGTKWRIASEATLKALFVDALQELESQDAGSNKQLDADRLWPDALQGLIALEKQVESDRKIRWAR